MGAAAFLVNRNRTAGVERDSLNSYRNADDYNDFGVDEDDDEIFTEIHDDDDDEPSPIELKRPKCAIFIVTNFVLNLFDCILAIDIVQTTM